MRLNPFLNALAAEAYIGAIALLMRFISSFRHDTPDTFVDSMAFLSLFVFSAAIMGFLFTYQPAQLFFENKKSEAISYFLKTIGIFGAITALILAMLTVLYGAR